MTHPEAGAGGNADEFEAWFRLLETPRLGPVQARQLLAAFGSPEAVLRAPPSALRAFVPAAVATALAGAPAESFAQRLAHAHSWLRQGEGARRYVPLGDPAYPPRLLQTADPPTLLYAEGAMGIGGRRAVAVVGSRNPTPQGLLNAREFAAELSRQGFVVISGLAVGIDAAAHEGALRGPAGTVAVLGAGLDQFYPASHAGLARRIVEGGGLLLSEYAPGTPPLKENFPRRNRIIAGLSLGTLVVEAALRSGSLITARFASEAGREVFAIPGSIHSPQAKGCHALIKQGAKLVEVAADIVDELQPESPPPTAIRATAASGGEQTEPGDALLQALGHDPVTLDALQARTGWATAELNARLLELELLGQVARLPGGLFQRQSAA
ncbi:MAG: DNA-protecting protein DprA [Rubrivivax sp.]|nr:DNA-protecting protein DprA [Rubrivivax sp.]